METLGALGNTARNSLTEARSLAGNFLETTRTSQRTSGRVSQASEWWSGADSVTTANSDKSAVQHEESEKNHADLSSTEQPAEQQEASVAKEQPKEDAASQRTKAPVAEKAAPAEASVAKEKPKEDAAPQGTKAPVAERTAPAKATPASGKPSEAAVPIFRGTTQPAAEEAASAEVKQAEEAAEPKFKATPPPKPAASGRRSLVEMRRSKFEAKSS